PVKEYNALRSFASLLAEVILCRHFGWKIGFVSGGVGALPLPKLEELLKYTTQIYGDKVWINIGAVGKTFLERLKPYIHGVIGTVECVNEKVHDFVCPSKPLIAVSRMFEQAKEAGVRTGMTLITGLGETKEDFPKLKEWIEKYNLEKIHMYGLNPVKGTYFENHQPPSKEYHAWWIAQTRIHFPKCDIQCGIWTTKADHVSLLLKAGSNSISKFPALKKFGQKEAFEVENQAKLAGRTFKGTLTNYTPLEKIDLSFLPEDLKTQVEEKLKMYLKSIERNLNRQKISVPV
ncbi:hypothetical protein HY837_00750, partial [archaeon]|nr:hypothetical protein [archaeon]